MKRFFALCAACACLFACGNSNPGVDILDNALDAAKDGNFEQAWTYMQEFDEWEESLTPEEQEKYGDAVEVWFDKHEAELEKEMEEYFEDLGDGIKDWAEDVTDNVKDAAEDLAKDAEKALENAAEAIEDLFK